jgi:hypothetical protein
MTTPFYDQITILGKLYNDYRDLEDYTQFFAANDIGLPLAWLHHLGMCMPSEEGIGNISQTFSNLLSALEIEDIGFTTLGELLAITGNTEFHEEDEDWIQE